MLLQVRSVLRIGLHRTRIFASKELPDSTTQRPAWLEACVHEDLLQ
jgi:hypothetical protein